jgi:ADP-heptose:LPS heptosyltransferase
MRILIVRLSAIGDTIHTLPLAAALRRLYPTAWIGWVVEKPSAPLVENNPILDWTYVLPKGWLKSFREIRALRRALRGQKPDIVFDVQGLSKSAVAAYVSGAPVRIGFTRGESREIAPYLDNRRVAPRGVHAIDKTLSLLDALEAESPGPAEFVFPPCSSGDGAALCEMPERFVLMGPWGSFTAKLWPLERFLQTAVVLHAKTGLRSFMLGHGEKERSAVLALSAERPDILQPAPDVSITGVVELARRASVFIGCDSFPMHAAAAVGCPTLGLFGVTNPERLGPYGPNGHAVYERLTLPRSTRERARLSNENMAALSVGKVVKSALAALQKPL